ncbi:MAG: glycosyltransferase [Nitrososphaerales archaeon]
MPKAIKLCINTQTPPVRFKTSYQELIEKYGGSSSSLDSPLSLKQLVEGIDYDFTPGGVTAMIYPAVKQMTLLRIIDKPNWISLGPGAPEKVDINSALLHNVWLDRKQLSSYANFKEGIWNEIHGQARLSFKPEEYEAYVEYNWLCAKLMLGMLKDIDLYWIHDFQQLYLGNLIGASAPAVFQWHIPFNLSQVSERTRMLVLKSIEGFDAVVVSTKRDLQGLIHAGYRGKAYAIAPYLDQNVWRKPSLNLIEATRMKFHLGPDEGVLLVVARMDPVKNQDVAIKALSKVRKHFPDLKLVLAGNGSFSGSATGGLGHPKSATWRLHLEAMIRDLKLENSVMLTGHVDHEELNALYSMAEAVIVPSNIEGFNLTAVEGWLHAKPCVVSDGAGVAELVHNEVNGFTFKSGSADDLADKIVRLLSVPEAGLRMGENGSKTASQCYVESAIQSIKQVFEEASTIYSHS